MPVDFLSNVATARLDQRGMGPRDTTSQKSQKREESGRTEKDFFVERNKTVDKTTDKANEGSSAQFR